MVRIAPPVASIIIPTYNEADNIIILLEKLSSIIENIPGEIIVVDDNSPDETWRIAQEYSRKDDRVHIIRRLQDRGLSSAVVTGMEVARGECLLVMDADLQHDETIIPEMIRAITEKGYDVAVGSRASGGGSYGEWSRGRRFISWMAAQMARPVLHNRISDPMSGFFAVSSRLFQQSANLLNPRGFKILLEFIARNRNLKILEIGYTFRNRVHGKTKLSGSVIRNYLIALYDLKFGRYLSPTFFLYGLVGISGVGVNLAGFSVGEYILHLPAITTGISPHIDPLLLSVPFGIQLSIMSNYILNNYVTFYETRHQGWAHLRGAFTFQAISLFGLFIQFAVFQLLYVNGFLNDSLPEGARKLASNGLGIVAATVSNYYLNLNITWKKSV